jgi:hypothetical protein
MKKKTVTTTAPFPASSTNASPIFQTFGQKRAYELTKDFPATQNLILELLDLNLLDAEAISVSLYHEYTIKYPASSKKERKNFCSQVISALENNKPY